ncbi:MAG: hypothetical protein IKE36_06205 [Solobacterium sp.]|nr:hypothetical protein [Solobacterium sp.]
MNIKRYLVPAVSIAVLLGGCAKPEQNNQPAQSATPEPTTEASTPEPTAEATAPAEDYSSLTGIYVDSIAGRGMLELKEGENDPEVNINWSSSAFQHNEWHMQVHYNEDHTSLEYQDCTMDEVTFDSAGKETRETRYTDGTGSFELVDDTLIWHDDQTENDEPVTFVRDTEFEHLHGMINPWRETTDPDDAEKIAGFAMDCPVDEAMPNDMVFRSFVCMDDVYGAMYDNGKEEMLIRKSSSIDPEELSGDFFTYSKSWDISLKGLTVHCLGDGKTVNNALFSNGEYNYVILYDAGNEGNGLTPDQLNSLIMSLQ